MRVRDKLKWAANWCVEFCVSLLVGLLALIGVVTLFVVVINLTTGACVPVTDTADLCLVQGFEPEGTPP